MFSSDVFKSYSDDFTLGGVMRVVAFIRVSTDRQTVENQKLEILTWANKERLVVDEFVEAQVSTRKIQLATLVDAIVSSMVKGDILVVTELSRLARSLRQLLTAINDLVERGLTLVSIKEGLRLSTVNQQDMTSKVMVTMFSLLYEVERDMISERTKRGLDRARASGKLLGRPRGRLSKSKLDMHADDIREMVRLGCPFAVLGRKFGCHSQTVSRFARSRGLIAMESNSPPL